jgi:preprotein translocase subunit YajC
MYIFFAQTQATQRPPMTANLVFIGLIFLIFYFLIIRPQKQKQLEHQKMVQSLKKNDEVVTIGGIHGTIVNVKDNSVVLRIADNVKIEVQKNAIAGLKKSNVEVSGEGIEKKT